MARMDQGQRWDDVLAGVQTLADLIQTCQDAFGEDEAAPKVCAAAAGSCPCSGFKEQYLIVPAVFAGICHDQEASHCQGHAGTAGWISASSGTHSNPGYACWHAAGTASTV